MRPPTHRIADLDDAIVLLERALREAEDDDEKRAAAVAKIECRKLQLRILSKQPVRTDRRGQ